jgi:hypothetical protein
MKMEGLLLAQVCGLRARCWQMELVISRLIRTGTPTIVALNNNNNNGLSCQLGVGQASQPASFFSFLFYFYLKWRERRGVSKRVLVLRRRRWGLSFLLCVDLSPPSKESWKIIKKSSERERDNNTIGFAIYYSTTTRVRAGVDFRIDSEGRKNPVRI